jgi:hypothetical protein
MRTGLNRFPFRHVHYDKKMRAQEYRDLQPYPEENMRMMLILLFSCGISNIYWKNSELSWYSRQEIK